MLTEYINAAMKRATYKTYEDGTIYGEIPGFQGVYANEDTRQACEKVLREVLEDWVMIGLYLHHPFPEVDGMTLTVKLAA